MSDYLSADRLRKFVLEFDDTRILVRRGLMLDVILDFFFQIFCAFRSLCQNDACLYDLTSYRIGSRLNSAFENERKFHDNAFDLKGTDAVAG